MQVFVYCDDWQEANPMLQGCIKIAAELRLLPTPVITVTVVLCITRRHNVFMHNSQLRI
jgi:hypothetical protein